MARSRSVWSLGGLSLALSACSAPAPQTSSLSSRIELAQNNLVFTLTNTELNERAPSARFREAAARATGALLAPLKDGAGQRLRAENGVSLRSSCGVTFIAPSYAVTAARCVDDASMDVGSLVVEMQRPTPALTEGFLHAAALSGTFPEFEHARLGEAEGYYVDRYSCTLSSRCSAAFGGPLNCDASEDSAGDEALLHCDGVPGAKYGFVELANEDDLSSEVMMAWQHEVYDVPLDESDSRFQHYVQYTADPARNYHYFDADSAGLENNQLLPLLSASFADGTPHRKLGAEQSRVTTDVFGCHGSSGAGALSPSAAGPWQLLGPFTGGGPETSGYLCDHVPALDGSSREPGSPGMHYQSLGETQALVAQNQPALQADCAANRGSFYSLFNHSSCLRQPLQSSGENSEFLAHLAPPTRPSRWEAWQDPKLLLHAGESLSLTAFEVQAGQAYRLGLEAWTSVGCRAGSCPYLEVSIEGRAVLSHTFEANAASEVLLAAGYVPAASGFVTLSFSVDAGERFELAGLTLRPEADRNDFDSLQQRLEASLIDLREADASPQPVRFTGDGKQGFAAWLLAEERLVLTRQALPPGHRWSARFAAPGAQALRCGLLAQDGEVVVSADCTSGQVTLDDTAGSGAARGGFFVESSANSRAVSIDQLALASDAAPDSDQDGIPDGADPCPSGPLPESGTLQVDFEPAAAASVCLPVPSTIALTAPRLLNACEPARLRGYVSRVNGGGLAPFALPLSEAAPQALLPPGIHEITWQVSDRLDRVVSTFTQWLTVADIDDESCCLAPQLPLKGSSGGDSFVFNYATPACVFLGAGDDFMVVGAGSNLISGGPGADYLRAGGWSDVLDGGDGDDTLSASRAAPLEAYGGAGADTIDASQASSALIMGGPGLDVLVGSAGPDRIYPGADGAWVLASDGDDELVLYDACELTSSLHLFGGAGTDRLLSPVSRAVLEQAGVQLESIESVVVDDSRAYLSDCFTGN